MEHDGDDVWVDSGRRLGFGVWRNRERLPRDRIEDSPADTASFIVAIDVILAAAVVALFGCWNFLSIPQLDAIADWALPMGLLPVLGITGGRLFPYLFALPIVGMTIAGKTLRELSLRTIWCPWVLVGLSSWSRHCSS